MGAGPLARPRVGPWVGSGVRGCLWSKRALSEIDLLAEIGYGGGLFNLGVSIPL